MNSLPKYTEAHDILKNDVSLGTPLIDYMIVFFLIYQSDLQKKDSTLELELTIYHNS